ncbi:T9SS type A sorting domain-containing protein [Pedobacter sp. BS3]|uniref:T9SS type A sorting domain-containing protein n=1 Tax=Pedobacter sp. BS3 TaxID=2567937 RepID=UPI0011EDB661|nr:T9SS type A sorting domain-containing protein [Pedobacter sp. BS3]TZF84904.1 T9SS type A sorting domain-containing protein [Pedobacter sp. BS3]
MKKLITILALSIFVLNAHSQIIITGFMPSPKRTSANLERNYEYIQLMATQDITFGTGANSYTVVICRNGGVQAEGWARADQVHSFALTSGTVQKGEYFYIGGTEKIIAGAVTVSGNTVKSTDISETAPIQANRAKWISVHDYVAQAGDVVGNTIASTGDMIQGWTTGTSSNNDNADGIAVFAGATVTATTVPIDVVFYGSKIGSAAARTVSGNFAGYRLPVKNDYYDGTTDQYYGQGANTFFFNPTGMTPTVNGVDNGIFFKLEGEYDPSANTWTSPRTLKLIDLYNNGNWGVLADIEQNVTLPVTISSFTAAYQKQTGEIQLEWKTASEHNNARFDIYRASANKDFKLIGNKTGSGTTNVETSYSFTDRNPLAGTNYYKLVQVDADGKSAEYEKIVAVKTGLSSNAIVVNSSDQNVTVFYKDIADTKGSVEIADVLGRKLFKQTVLIDGNSLNLPISLQKGIYVLSLNTEAGHYTVKFSR